VRGLVATILTLCVACVAGAQPKGSAPDADSGRALAERWCQACHVIADGQRTAADAAPTFTELAAEGSKSDAQLRAFLMAPRHPMPPVELSSDEIEDLLAYIQALRANR